MAAEPITDVDTTAADVLFELDHMLDEHGQCLVFAELKDPVRRKIDGYGLTAKIEPEHLFPTVEAAVQEFRALTHAEWTPVGPTVVPTPRTTVGREVPVSRQGDSP